jgi:hypothetical protein
MPLSQIEPKQISKHSRRAAAISGTGNGDSFLRLAAVRTASAIARFSPGETSLQTAVTAVAGPNGMLQLSAEDRWHKTGEGEGGMIGIELGSDGVGRVVADFNCGGMFRAWVDGNGRERIMVFREEYWGLGVTLTWEVAGVWPSGRVWFSVVSFDHQLPLALSLAMETMVMLMQSMEQQVLLADMPTTVSVEMKLLWPYASCLRIIAKQAFFS